MFQHSHRSHGGQGGNRGNSHRGGHQSGHQSGHQGGHGGRAHSGGRSHHGGSSHGGGRPSGHSGGFHHGRGGFRGGAGGGRRGGRGRRDASIDVSKFINKAVAPAAPREAFVPEHRFSDFAIRPELKANIASKGYATPTPIQDRSIPIILAGSDMVGIADTGSGKTGAFLIPLVEKVIQARHHGRDERVLIMVPTRELATQIADELRGFAHALRIESAVAVGGVGIMPQIHGLRRRPSFVIGTPGRLKDLIERRALSLGDFHTVVLDEADRMLDMGFIHDMRRLLAMLPADRHTLFFSATLSREIESLIGEFLRSPKHVSVKTGDTSKDVDQDVIKVGADDSKLEVLHDLLIQPGFSRVLIFGRTKHGVERLAKTLSQRGFKAESIHGNKAQGARQRSLDRFKSGEAQILVATDVAARGIDIPSVSHVINYDLPATDEDYVHRIGRTGRAGKKGTALTFVEERR